MGTGLLTSKRCRDDTTGKKCGIRKEAQKVGGKWGEVDIKNLQSSKVDLPIHSSYKSNKQVNENQQLQFENLKVQKDFALVHHLQQMMSSMKFLHHYML